MTKLKQLLMKNKREMSEGKKREEELQDAIANLQRQLEEEKQGSELVKVEVSQVTARIQSMKQQVWKQCVFYFTRFEDCLGM